MFSNRLKVIRIGFWYSMAVLLLNMHWSIKYAYKTEYLKGKWTLKYNEKVTEDYKMIFPPDHEDEIQF